MNKRHQLRLALTRFKAFQDSEQRSDEILNQEFIDIAMAEARKKKSRQKLKDISDAAKILGKGPFEALRAPYAARAKEKVDEYIRERKARREAILKLCDGLLPQSGDKKIKVETRTTYEFSTQGGAAVFLCQECGQYPCRTNPRPWHRGFHRRDLLQGPGFRLCGLCLFAGRA